MSAEVKNPLRVVLEVIVAATAIGSLVVVADQLRAQNRYAKADVLVRVRARDTELSQIVFARRACSEGEPLRCFAGGTPFCGFVYTRQMRHNAAAEKLWLHQTIASTFDEYNIRLGRTALSHAGLVWFEPIHGADLEGIDFSNSDLRCAILNEVSLKGIRFDGANLECATLTQKGASAVASWKGAKCPDGTQLPKDGGSCSDSWRRDKQCESLCNDSAWTDGKMFFDCSQAP